MISEYTYIGQERAHIARAGTSTINGDLTVHAMDVVIEDSGYSRKPFCRALRNEPSS